mgnify:FL=1|tara:strand:+ start:650 stop:889 length:240 start_codon:yes stop_codon:yes gene_type:complete
MNKKPLTPRQKDVFDFLNLFFKHHQYMPTIKEIMAGKIEDKQIIDSRAQGPIGNTLKRIEARGWIERAEAGRARAIRVL